MRLLCGVLLVAACAGPIDPVGGDDDSDPATECFGGLPPPACGDGVCSCCVSCAQRDGLCMAPGWPFDLGIGECRADPAAGTLAVNVGATAFTAADVAAVVDGYLEVSARRDGATVAFVVPGIVGDYDCATAATVSFAYFDAAGSEYSNRPVNGTRPTCAIRVTAVGKVGERVEGTFAATLIDRSLPAAATLDLTAGTFSIERGAYP